MSRWPRIKTVGNQPSIFDQAERAKQAGIEASYQHASSYWKQAAKTAVLQCAQNYREFTADNVWEMLDKTGITTGENRALGAIIQAAHRSGMIQKTGQYKESYRRHNSPIPVWHSNVYNS